MKARLRNNQGIALVTVIMLMIVLITLTGASLLFSRLDLQTTSNYKRAAGAFYTAETGAESGAAQLQSLLNTVLNPTSSDLATITAPTVSGYTFPTFTVAPVGSVATQPIASGNFAGLTAYIQKYRITIGRRVLGFRSALSVQKVPCYKRNCGRIHEKYT